MNAKRITLIVMLALSALMSGSALAAEYVGTRVLEVWRDGAGYATFAVVATDWSDGSTTYAVVKVSRQ
jgi:hypothetical protein